ncbi:hypothetical protein QYE76_039970 [Lolium multiflorum]|uniref:Integrase catalytic domain-containing protein n=1 Tax=Lolium multiflorum TaxID=4521 RepID=A0AAD8TC39_LOLMU|nr:hypothetical protein QYE76_039970 [Lolium multiflorum]
MYESEIEAIRTNNGTEFKNYTMQEFVDNEGIKHEFSAPYTPQQNCVFERKNRTIIEMARTMLSEFKSPHNFWGEAISRVVHYSNRLFLRPLHNKTPYELLTVLSHSRYMHEALVDPDWVIAMQEELECFTRNEVWSLVERPKDHHINVIGAKWVFKNKKDENGIVIRNQARGHFPSASAPVLTVTHRIQAAIPDPCGFPVAFYFHACTIVPRGGPRTEPPWANGYQPINSFSYKWGVRFHFVSFPAFAYFPVLRALRSPQPRSRWSPPEPCSRRTCAAALAALRISAAERSTGASSPPPLRDFFGEVRLSPSPVSVGACELAVAPATFFLSNSAASG